MKIALAQIQSASGNISENIKKHVAFIKKAIDFEANLIVFPELSITNYEPKLAKELAATKNDKRFTVFQKLSDENNIVIGFGVPIQNNEGITISMLIFQPKKEILNYAKQLLHKDELPYFVPGKEQVYIKNKKIAFAVCYESMQEAHFLNACKSNTDIYIASVAKTEKNVQKGMLHYQNISEKHNKTIIMINSVGKCDDFISAGQSIVFKNGKQMQQLNNTQEEILIYNTELDN